METYVNEWIYALVGFFSILIHLGWTHHARLTPIDPGSGHAGCPDERVTKDILVFGGASAFTFGLPYFLAATWFSGSLSNLFLVYGSMQFVLSIIQTLTYLILAPSSKLESVPLKSHLHGCGYTTAWSPFWLLFWIQEFLPGFGWVVYVRDALTVFDFAVSLPATIVISLLTKIFIGKWTVPMIKSVDHPH